MSATAPVNTPERSGLFIEKAPVAASTTLFAGTLGAANASGYILPASDTAGLRVLGRIEPQPNLSVLDNSAGAAGDVSATIKRGVFQLANDATNPVTAAYLGKPVYVKDDSTVCVVSTNKVIAGVFVGFLDGDTSKPLVDTTRMSAVVPSADTLTALTFTSGGATGPEVAALRAAVLAILQAQNLVK